MSKYVDGVNEDRFDLFLKDLRSGGYKQGKGALHIIETFRDGSKSEKLCCLGVACLRPASEGVVSSSRPTEDSDYDVVRYDGWNTVDLPNKVADYLGIPQENRIDLGEDSCNVAFFRMGYDPENGETMNLTAIGFNDTLGKSFAEIADAFEAEFVKEEA